MLEKLKALKPIHWVAIFFGIAIYIGATIGVIDYQKSHKSTTPKLEITSPVEGEVYKTKTVSVQGLTNAKATVSSGDYKTSAKEDGTFELNLPLEVGENTFVIVAESSGVKNESEITVSREAVKTVAKPTKSDSQKSASKEAKSARLNNSGPESFWLLEAGVFSAAVAAYQVSREKLRSTKRGL